MGFKVHVATGKGPRRPVGRSQGRGLCSVGPLGLSVFLSGSSVMNMPHLSNKSDPGFFFLSTSVTAKVGSLHTPHGSDSLFFLTWKGLCCGSYMMGVVLGHKLAPHPHLTSTQTQPPLSGSSLQQMSRQPQLGAEAPILQLEKSGCLRRILPRPLGVSLGAPSPRTHSTRTGELRGWVLVSLVPCYLRPRAPLLEPGP